MKHVLKAASFAAARLGLFVLTAVIPIHAQPAPPPAPVAPSALPSTLESFEVTGSRIKRTDLEGPSPIHVITREEIDLAAATNLTDIMRDIPEATNLGINEGVATGFVVTVSALDLRALGPNNTLVLVDGRRQAPNGLSSNGTVFVDLNRFPNAMIERVEVLKDGASAVYGADATAGVVNVILRKHYTGAEISVRYGNYLATDVAEQSYSFLGGAARGRARATVALTFSSRNSLAATDLPISASADFTEQWRAKDALKYASKLTPTATQVSYYDQRSLAGPYATVSVPTAAQLAAPRNALPATATRNPATGSAYTFLPGTGGQPQGTLGSTASPASVPRGNNPARPAAAQFVARAFPAGEFSNSYDYQPYLWLVPSTGRRSISTHLDYEVTRTVGLYATLSQVRIASETSLAPAPIATGNDNAILVPASNHYNPFGIPLAFTYRSLEVGPRLFQVRSKSWNALAGLKGTLRERFDWDLGWSYSQNENTNTTINALSETRLLAALARTTPDALNIFGGPGFRNDPATLDSFKITTVEQGRAATMLFDLRVSSARLFALPWGAVGSSLALEHRRERYELLADDFARTLDDVIGSSRGVDTKDTPRNVESVAAEVRVPLVREGRHRYLHTVELNGAARFETFSDGYDSGVKPFAGLRVRFTRDFLLRASSGKVFRAPTLPQLYAGTLDNTFTGLPDLRRPTALTGDSADASTAPRLVRSGGNPRLLPENGTTKQIGTVIDLPWKHVKGLSLEFTHGVIEQDNVIRAGLGLGFIRQNELASTADLVQREPGTETYRNNTSAPINVLSGPAGATTPVAPGQTVTVPGRITMIQDAALNLSNQIVRYYDYGLRYQLNTPGLGRWVVSSNWTYYGYYAFRRQTADAYVPSVGRSLPRYRGQSSVTWRRARWSANLGMTYIHRHRDLNIDRWEVERYYTFSAGAGYAFPDKSFLRGTRVSVGLENLFNRAPSLDEFATGYDTGLVGRPAGRFGFVALRKSL